MAKPVLSIYELSRDFWDFAFENKSVKPTHVAIYFFAIEHCNRLGWKHSFGLPTSMVVEAIGVKSYSAYKKHFDELVTWEFFEVKEYSKNQFSSNVIALKKKAKATTKALDKALTKHTSKQVQSTSQSNDSIDIPIYNIPINLSTNIQEAKPDPKKFDLVFPYQSIEFLQAWDILLKTKNWKKKEYSALQASLKKLSHQPERYAIKMVENAIAGEWKGLFELKQHEKNEIDGITEKGNERDRRQADILSLDNATRNLLRDIENGNNAGSNTG